MDVENKHPVIQLVSRPEKRLSAEQDDAARCLQLILDRAKAGEIVTVAIVGILNDGSLVTIHSLVNAYSQLIGGISLLERRVIDDWIEPDQAS